MVNYGLDAAHFHTSPALAWSAALKVTDVELDVVTDIDQCLFIDRAVVGGISLAVFPYARANNHYLPDFEPSLPTFYIVNLDCNNQVIQV